MALLFIDSFEHYVTAKMGRKWTSPAGSIGAVGRTGNGLTTSTVVGMTPSKTLPVTSATLCLGVAWKSAGLSGDWTLTNAFTGLTVRLNQVGDGRLYVNIGIIGYATDSSNTSAASIPLLTTGNWYYIEFYCAITSTGSPPTQRAVATFEVRINGESEFTGSVSHLYNGSDFTLAAFSFSGVGGGSTTTWDDLYVTDGEFLGDVTIGVLYPNADTATVQWTPSTGSDHFSLVNEHSPDDDTSYVSCAPADIGNVDLYELDDIDGAFDGDIKGVQAIWCVKKTDAGDATVIGQYANGGAPVDAASNFPPSFLNYLYYIDAQRVNPIDSSDWDIASVNALQLGIKRDG